MKIRLLLALVGWAIGFALPTFAQPTDAIDSQTHAQIDEQIDKKFDEAFNNGDAAALAALFTQDAVWVTPQGPVVGREAIQQRFAGMFQQGHYRNHLNNDDPGSPHWIGTAGTEVWRTGAWSFTLQGKGSGPLQLKGHFGAINVREGEGWKIRMLTFNVTPPPAAMPSPTATPSSR